ncbi:hypothetical protein [Variovorax rhizosphaerae]|uniref:Uncharacterized protein n=1 Tax=Variovorax rhizosphaerae TaxID=1836200 RepID=A0ABU8WIB4_9BURK
MQQVIPLKAPDPSNADPQPECRVGQHPDDLRRIERLFDHPGDA